MSVLEFISDAHFCLSF